MAIQPSDLIAVANALSAAMDEPSDRSAISRAYYAAFHHAKAWHDSLLTPGHDVGPRGGEHQTLINCLRNPEAGVLGPVTAKNSRMLAAKLEVLRNRRIVSDYKLTQAVTRPDCDQQLVQAAGVLQQY